ncbi:hypothetical protein [Cellulosimicrobium sp. CUA-896]|uniref:hypothetical protein n=1 Tax=Cellulosimicrobium sp. CUA-896 TaxID=1517881 RepID=UPI001300F325|nr:hypothetical protein [Cellulosimicrobium sp. CUA-896]
MSTLMTALGLLAPTRGASAAAAPVLTVAGDYLVSLDGQVRMAVDEAAAEGHAEQVVLASRGRSLLLAALVEDGVDPGEAERLVAARLALDDGTSRAAFTSAFKEAAGLAEPTGTPELDPTATADPSEPESTL